MTDQDDYTKNRNYWKYLKAKLKKDKNKLVSITTQLKLLAPDGKKRLADVLDYDEIIDKYVVMNIAHPFMEGNGRCTRIWLDLMLKRSLKKCMDWSKIAKNDYHQAMINSLLNSQVLKEAIKTVLTEDIHSREMFRKGIDYSYYYEEK